VSERVVRVVLLGLAGALLVVPLATDWPALSGGRFWSDGATYTMMAQSLALDGDSRYEERDLERVLAEFPGGPDGVFLKRASGGLRLDLDHGFPWLTRVPKDRREIYYAKALLHPLFAAPFVRLFGVRGMLVANGAFLALALLLGYRLTQPRLGPVPGLLATLALAFGSAVPLYLAWPQTEIFGLTLVLLALAAWQRRRPLLSALGFGLATYLKPTNVLLALPLGVAPLLDTTRPLAARARETLRRGGVLALAAVALFGLNAAVTGEVNYQGGERKTFSGRFPGSGPRVTFGDSGFWMTTEHVGPRLEGQDAAGQRGALAVAGRELRQAFLLNLAYFWIGRNAGVVPYFLPVAAALLAFFGLGPRSSAGWLGAAGLLLSGVALLWLIPDNWYGGGGTLGNRYFLNLLPLAFLALERRSAPWVAVAGALGAAVFIAPMAREPIQAGLHPGRHLTEAAFRVFPLELTTLNELGFNHDAWRKKQPFGTPEGDPHRKYPPDPRGYWLYFVDDGTYGRELAGGIEGFWLRGGQSAEIVMRATEPVSRIRLQLLGGPNGDRVSASVGKSRGHLALTRDQRGELELRPGPGLLYYDSLVYLIRLESQAGLDAAPPLSDDARVLGAFVHLELEVTPRRVGG
jgi:hypothetical protein